MDAVNPYDVRRLEGKVAVVTGGSGGLGRAIVARLGSEGAEVAVIDLAGGTAEADAPVFAADMTKAADVGHAMSQIRDRFGRLDILVNNVGGGGSPAKLLVDLEEEYWNASLANNLTSTFLGTQAFVRCLEHDKTGCAVVNMSSLSGKLGTPLLGPYSVAKAGVIRLTEVLARELADRGIRVNAVCPSVVDTPLSAKMLDRHPETFVRAYDLVVNSQRSPRRALEEKVPLGRLGTSAEVATLVAYLASDEAAYVTGQSFNVNGGLITH